MLSDSTGVPGVVTKLDVTFPVGVKVDPYF